MARDYAKITPSFWTGETGRRLRGDSEAQLIALYLVTCPHANMIGIFYMPLPLLCHETGSPLEGASKALRRLSEAGFAYYDETTEHVWIPEMATYQVGETVKPGDNRRAAVQKMVKGCKSLFVNDFIEKYGEVYGLERQAPSKPLGSPLEAPPKPESSEQLAVNSKQVEPKPLSSVVPTDGDAIGATSRITSNGTARKAYDQAYLDWYVTFVRKTHKADGAKAWRKLSKPNILVILKNSPAWMDYLSTRDTENMPYPATFINSRCWEEQPPEHKPAKQKSFAEKVMEATGDLP